MGMGGHVPVRVPSSLADSASVTEILDFPSTGHHFDSANMADKSLVSASHVSEEGGAVGVTVGKRSVISTTQSGSKPSLSGAKVSCMEIVKGSLISDGFSDIAAGHAATSCRGSTLRAYDAKLALFFAWAREKGISPLLASRPQVAEFLVYLFSVKELSPRTIRGYRSAIAKVHPGWDGVSVGKEPILSAMINSFFIQRPPVRKLIPNWDLQLVLNKLCDAPFEPLCKAELKWLSLKTLFLVAVASGRRVSCLHALSVADGHFRQNQSGTTLVPAPGFLAKNDTLNYIAKAIVLTKMSRVSSVPEDRLLCPCRALRVYVERTRGIRGDDDHLFLCFAKNRHGPASRDTLARWLVELVEFAYRESSTRDFERARAHDTRSISANWALLRGVSAQDILEAASWQVESTFSSFYVRDLMPSRASFSQAVISSATVGR